MEKCYDTFILIIHFRSHAFNVQVLGLVFLLEAAAGHLPDLAVDPLLDDPEPGHLLPLQHLPSQRRRAELAQTTDRNVQTDILSTFQHHSGHQYWGKYYFILRYTGKYRDGYYWDTQ